VESARQSLSDRSSDTKSAVRRYASFLFSLDSRVEKRAELQHQVKVGLHAVEPTLSIFEAVTGLLIFGALVAKFVSRRQDELVRDIYNVTFENCELTGAWAQPTSFVSSKNRRFRGIIRAKPSVRRTGCAARIEQCVGHWGGKSPAHRRTTHGL
jgi:hypothetical protein